MWVFCVGRAVQWAWLRHSTMWIGERARRERGYFFPFSFLCVHVSSQLAHQEATAKGEECGAVGVIKHYCCYVCFGCMTRAAIREKYGIEGSCPVDFFTMYCCGVCAISQHQRQLIAKGDKPAGCFTD